MKVYVLICPTTGKYLKNTMARYSDKYELCSDLDESFSSENHHVPVSLKNSNEHLNKFRLAIREHEPEMNADKKHLLKCTLFKGRGRLSTHKRRMIKRGR